MFQDLFQPLFHNTIILSVLIGLGAPLLGVFLILRRMVFMGVALPSISSTGVALALSLHVWFGDPDGDHGLEQQGLAFAGSMIFSLVAVLWLAFLDRNRKGSSEGRIGTAYVVATAVSLLLLAKCPAAERGWLNRFKGEIIGVGSQEVWMTLITLVVVIGLLLWFRKEFLLVSFDRELALSLKKNVFLWDVFLYLLIGVTIAICVLSAGPLITFAFMVIPPLVSHLFAGNMRQFFLISSLLGGVVGFGGFAAAYHWNLPVGPTGVALLGAIYAISWVSRKIFR